MFRPLAGFELVEFKLKHVVISNQNLFPLDPSLFPVNGERKRFHIFRFPDVLKVQG